MWLKKEEQIVCYNVIHMQDASKPPPCSAGLSVQGRVEVIRAGRRRRSFDAAYNLVWSFLTNGEKIMSQKSEVRGR